MGVGPFKKSCYTNIKVTKEVLPNPNPSRWILLDQKLYDNSYVLKVNYLDCINFEGIKILVFKGKYKHRTYLDPHFSTSDLSPFARFKPTSDGWKEACELAKKLDKEKKKK